MRSELQLVPGAFGELTERVDEPTVRRYARAYIMILLGTQLFADKSSNRIHIRWLPYVARLEDMDGYSWGSASLSWLYRCMCRVANRHVSKLVEPLQLLQSWIFWRFPKFRPAGYDTSSWPLASRYYYIQKALILTTELSKGANGIAASLKEAQTTVACLKEVQMKLPLI
ncbi:hypothetical protein Ahy_A09g042466 [Arachis hypogaea]|uniref:Aminotransferase-like plant mobile domain-containing protein n=1 Tax=Arachis hypogaea TaxID=3818 RepID=A0A445BFX8_ARAHY|nr:hypothetical protein Ahy_A09g042466 [Arachis hypogaea]